METFMPPVILALSAWDPTALYPYLLLLPESTLVGGKY